MTTKNLFELEIKKVLSHYRGREITPMLEDTIYMHLRIAIGNLIEKFNIKESTKSIEINLSDLEPNNE